MRLLLFCLLLFSAHLLACQLTVRLEHFIPQAQRIDDNQWHGVDFELTDTLLSEAGCQYQIIELPWARALESLIHGSIDMMLNVTKTEKRALNYYFIGPTNNESIVLAIRNDLPVTLKKAEDILTLSQPIAIQRLAFYGEIIDKLLKDPKNKNNFIQVVDNEEKFYLLRSGRISGFLEAKRNLVTDTKNTPRYQDIGFAPLILHQSPVYYAFSKRSINLALFKKLSSAFERLQAKNKIEKMTP